ncbi:MAG: hypothetical protein LWY06_00970 [Firmicutes bacterium]|nr:hypothetical protein [Bacillota bacterium]
MRKIPVYLAVAAFILFAALPVMAFVIAQDPEEIITAQQAGGMRPTSYGWSNPVPVRYVTPPGGPAPGPYGPNGPYYGPNSYYNYWIPLGVGTSNTSNFPTFDTNPVRVDPPSTPPKPPDPKTQAADTINQFMAALKYNDISKANSIVPVSMQARSAGGNSSGYIGQRLGKIYQWKIQDVKNVSGTTFVVTALITLTADMNYTQEQKSFTVSQGKIVDPF